jgi:hypothetical protein
MDAKKIIRILALAAVVVAAFVPSFEYWTLIITLLGLGVGWHVSQEADDERLRFMVATLVLFIANDALGAIPALGEYLDTILSNASDLFNAAAIEVVFIAVVKKLQA